MANILKITTPNAGYDNNLGKHSNTVRHPQVPDHQSVATDSTRVNQSHTANLQQPNQENITQHQRFESNFQTFFSQLQSLPSITEGFAELFFERFSLEQGTSPTTFDSFTNAIAELFDSVNLSKEELLSYLKSQTTVCSKFQGSFFQLLNKALQQTNSLELKYAIHDFLKAYTNLAESNHIQAEMDAILQDIGTYLFPLEKSDLTELIGKLQAYTGQNPEAIAQNVSTLKQEILPFLSAYVKSTHNLGPLRDQVALLASLIARYENGTEENLSNSFLKLLDFRIIKELFPPMQSDFILHFLRHSDYERTLRKESFPSQLAALIEDGVDGKAGTENISLFKNMMQSILLNESVYLPIHHMVIPLSYQGTHMLSELWIDPSASQDKGKSNKKPGISGLLKFHIDGVGLFDLYFFYEQKNIQLQLSCPTSFTNEVDTIRNDLTRILTSHDMEVKELYVDSDATSLSLLTAFPALLNRKDSINVKI